MSFKDIVLCILNNKGKTLTLELREYMKKQAKEEVTKQAFSKQRQNINPEIFKILNEDYVRMMYEQKEIERYKGYLLISVDGSIIELPNKKELKEYYGCQEGQKGSVGRVRARALCIYDALNHIIIRSRIDKYNMSEKEQIKKEIEKVLEQLKGEKIIMVFDRYYFGVGFIHLLEKLGIKYIIRMRINDYKKEKKEMKSNDEEVRLKIRSNTIVYIEKEEEKEELKALKEIETRIIKTTIESGEEHIVTNLSKEELTEEEAKELYGKRWEIEKAFDILKNKQKIENFSSYKVIGIEQDFYAQVYIYNVLEDIKSDGGEIKKKAGWKYEYKVNMNIMVGIFKEKLMEIITAKDKRELRRKKEEIMEEIKKYIVPIKPGRKYPRKRMHSMNKYRHNLRKNS